MRKGFTAVAVCLVLSTGLSKAAPAPCEKAAVCVAEAFDFPVGKPDGLRYYKARGFQANGHLGEDWNGGPGDTDLGLPVSSVGNGIVVFARDVKLGWGNVVIIRHCYFEQGELHCIDSLYGHLNEIQVQENQLVRRGQQVGTIGNNHGMYDAHLHFEIRSNLRIGMARAQFARDFSNYMDPTSFIEKHRTAPGGPPGALIAINTFILPGSSYQEPGYDSVTVSQPPPRVPPHTTHRTATFKIDRFGQFDNWQM